MHRVGGIHQREITVELDSLQRGTRAAERTAVEFPDWQLAGLHFEPEIELRAAIRRDKHGRRRIDCYSPGGGVGGVSELR